MCFHQSTEHIGDLSKCTITSSYYINRSPRQQDDAAPTVLSPRIIKIAQLPPGFQLPPPPQQNTPKAAGNSGSTISTAAATGLSISVTQLHINSDPQTHASTLTHSHTHGTRMHARLHARTPARTPCMHARTHSHACTVPSS